MKAFLAGLLGGLLAVCGVAFALNNHYVGFNPNNQVNTIPGQWVDAATPPQGLVTEGGAWACTFTNQHGGTNAGSFQIAGVTGGSGCGVVLTDGAVAGQQATGIVGYTCFVIDETAQNIFWQSANTATSCTVEFSGAQANDTVIYIMIGYGDQ